MADLFHVDTQFLRNALGVFEDLAAFENAARTRDAESRASNVATLIDALDLCNLLVLGDAIAFDVEVGGGRQDRIVEQIDRVARSLGDAAVADMFRDSFAGVAPATREASWQIELEAARDAATFFPRLARCATNVLDLFHLPRKPPTEPAVHLMPFVAARKAPAAPEVDALLEKKGITGRRFYAAMLSHETAFNALCEAHARAPLTDDALAVLFMNFRLRLAEHRAIADEKLLRPGATRAEVVKQPLVYLPSMGRRDFSREFSRFVRWGSDPGTRSGHAFDIGLREYVVQNWEGVGCQMHLSERRAIPLVVASVLGSRAVKDSPLAPTLLTECLRWKRQNAAVVEDIRTATRAFEALDEEKRKEAAAEYVAELLKSPSTESARNRSLAERFALRDQWLGIGIRVATNPTGALEKLAVDSVDKLRKHFAMTESREYTAATHLSEAARPLLQGVGPDIRQRLIDIFGGTVLDARNPTYDPDRFPAAA